MAVIASGIATFLHEGAGHGVIAWLQGDTPTELTSSHLTTLWPDRWVDAGGTTYYLRQNLTMGGTDLDLLDEEKGREYVAKYSRSSFEEKHKK